MMNWAISNRTLGPFFSSENMALVWSDEARIQTMLDVEAALARAQAALSLIPAEAAEAITAAARAENLDLEALGREVQKAGNLAIPFVKALTAVVRARDEAAARWVHWGSTSQDIIDTALVLQMREAFGLIGADLDRLGDRLAELAETYAQTPMIGRTLMQQAVPTTLGVKLAGWLSALTRARQSLAFCRDHALAVQFGGAAGNLASYGSDGMALSRGVAADLNLKLPELPWHAERDRIAETGSCLARLLGSLGKMAGDLALMAQTEVGEFSEPSGDGRGGSSAMPHKANPVACARIIAAAKRAPGLAATLLGAMDQEHERGLGGWHAEWEVLPELFRLASAALEAACFALEHGRFDVARMRQNLELTSGLVMAEAASAALARKVGKAASHALIERASRRAVAEKRPLRDALQQDAEVAPRFDAAEFDALFTPENHLGSAPEFARRAASAWRLGVG
jgi:3-carboxy-cis,cis-muconate cycloisomerase